MIWRGSPKRTLIRVIEQHGLGQDGVDYYELSEPCAAYSIHFTAENRLLMSITGGIRPKSGVLGSQKHAVHY